MLLPTATTADGRDFENVPIETAGDSCERLVNYVDLDALAREDVVAGPRTHPASAYSLVAQNRNQVAERVCE